MRGGSRSPRLLTYDMVRVQYEYVPTCALPSSRSLPVSCSPEEEPISSRSRMSGWRGREEKEEKGETREEGIKKGGPKRGFSAPQVCYAISEKVESPAPFSSPLVSPKIWEGGGTEGPKVTLDLEPVAASVALLGRYERYTVVRALLLQSL